MSTEKTAILFGGTGLVGRHCLTLLLEVPRYGAVVSFGRRLSGITHPKLTEYVVDFNRIEDFCNSIRGDDLFYCLGTTLDRAKSREAFRRVDYDYPVAIARAAAANGISNWLMISSIGASATSPNFYLRVKGELERKISGSAFRGVHIFRPSLLLGERSERRFAEVLAAPVMKALSPLLMGPLRKYRPTPARTLARRMIEVAKAESSGVAIHYLE